MNNCLFNKTSLLGKVIGIFNLFILCLIISLQLSLASHYNFPFNDDNSLMIYSLRFSKFLKGT